METEETSRDNAPAYERNSTSKNEDHDKAVDDETRKIIHEIVVKMLEKRTEEMKHNGVKQINSQIDDMVSEVVNRLEKMSSEKVICKDSSNYREKKEPTKGGALLEKQFLERESVLTELFKIKHIRTVYNIFISIWIVSLVKMAISDILTTGSMNIGFSTITLGFGKFTDALQIWFLMVITTFMIYPAYNIWAYKRADFYPKSIALKIWDYGWLINYIVYQIAFIVLPCKALLEENLPVVSSFALLMEQVRMVMKTHAFVRSASPRFLAYKPHTESRKPNGPSFMHFLYFLFAPTLIYQDSYPRTKKIRWKIVIWNYMEIILIIFYIAFLYEYFFNPLFHQFGTHSMDRKTLILNVSNTMIPSIMLFTCGFYCLLHSWLNASAELLRFADRLFYKDWWNSTSYDTYYRAWNVVVHDWLYIYIYKDMCEIVTSNNRFLSTCVVFVISAIFHEYIIAISLRFFYPIMLMMLGGLSLFLTLVKKRTSNIFLWLSLIIGNGIMHTLYFTEYYARQNCSPYYGETLDLFLPRSWSCYRS